MRASNTNYLQQFMVININALSKILTTNIIVVYYL